MVSGPDPNAYKKSGLQLVLTEPRYNGNGRANPVTASMVSHLYTPQAKQTDALTIICTVTSDAAHRVA